MIQDSILVCSADPRIPHTALSPMRNVVSTEVRSKPSNVDSVFNIFNHHSDCSILIHLGDSKGP
jgi:hypothetical protein